MLMRALKEIHQEIIELCAEATTEPTPTKLQRVLIIKGEVPDHQLSAIYEPIIGLVLQGSKTINIGSQSVGLNPLSYFLIPTEMPASGFVKQGKNGKPYVSVGLQIDQDVLLDLLKEMPPNKGIVTYVSSRFTACPANQDFLEAWLRLLRLLKHPDRISALSPIYEREILFHVLVGPDGWRLRHLFKGHNKRSSIHRMIQWIRQHYKESFEIDDLSSRACMGITTFHRQFKSITGLSPIQFQKQLRLLEARKLLAFSGYSVTDAAFDVGYESASQFNREYSRFFGSSPARDARALKNIYE